MPKKISVILTIMVSVLTLAVIYLFTGELKILKTINEEAMTVTMVFVDGMNYVTPVPVPDTVTFAGELVPLDIFYVREQLERELTVNTYWHSSTIMLLKRGARWFPVIEPILQQEGIPDDFKYITLIESGLLNVVSPSGAAGFWQFLEGTAKDYGLEVDKRVDERYHPIKATRAACKYLRKSYDRLGDWTLVAASYNAGQSRISELKKSQKAHSYYEMYLSDETSRYVFRAIALKLIYEQPQKYGFKLQKGDYYDPIPTRSITVKNNINELPAFAREHKTSYRMLKELNPWLRSDKLTVRRGSKYEILLPAR